MYFLHNLVIKRTINTDRIFAAGVIRVFGQKLTKLFPGYLPATAYMLQIVFIDVVKLWFLALLRFLVNVTRHQVSVIYFSDFGTATLSPQVPPSQYFFNKINLNIIITVLFDKTRKHIKSERKC